MKKSLCNGSWERIDLSFCSAGLPAGLRKTCGTFVKSSKSLGSPHKPRGSALQIKKHLIELQWSANAFLLPDLFAEEGDSLVGSFKGSVIWPFARFSQAGINQAPLGRLVLIIRSGKFGDDVD